MPEPTLDSLPRLDIAFILNETAGLPLHIRRERMYRWSLDRGGNMSLVESVLYNEPSYAKDVEEYKTAQAEAWKKKLAEDEKNIAGLKKEKRWDSIHNCEIPKPNTDDPQERRFRHNAGSDKSADVTWDSHTPGGAVA